MSEIVGTLTDIQVRVLGCLIEKEATTPDQYPLTLNSLKLACNQKSSRFPVMSYEEGQVGHAIRELEGMGLVSAAWSTRAAKYEHHFQKSLDIRQKDVAILCVLMLRGAQTAGELRARSQRIYEFDDIDDVEYVLNRLAEREPAMVMKLPRQAGQSIQRYAHLLSGEPEIDEIMAAPAAQTKSELEERVSALEGEVQALRRMIEDLQS